MSKGLGKRRDRASVRGTKVAKTRAPKKSAAANRKAAWRKLEKLWASVVVDSGGDRLTRDELHERG